MKASDRKVTKKVNGRFIEVYELPAKVERLGDESDHVVLAATTGNYSLLRQLAAQNKKSIVEREIYEKTRLENQRSESDGAKKQSANFS